MNIDAKILEMILQIKYNNTVKGSSVIYTRVLGWFKIHKSINVIPHINKMRNKNHMIISIDSEKAFDKIQHPFIIKALNKMGSEGKFLNIIKATCGKHTADIITNGEKLKSIPLKRNKAKLPTLALLLNTLVRFLPEQLGKEKK